MRPHDTTPTATSAATCPTGNAWRAHDPIVSSFTTVGPLALSTRDLCESVVTRDSNLVRLQVRWPESRTCGDGETPGLCWPSCSSWDCNAAPPVTSATRATPFPGSSTFRSRAASIAPAPRWPRREGTATRREFSVAATATNRLFGTLSGSVRPTPWLAFALRLDGRYEHDVDPVHGNTNGYVGDPRLFARIGTDLPHGLRIGAQLGLWLPGDRPPSLVLKATTVNLVALAAYAPAGSPLVLAAHAGGRWDNSAQRPRRGLAERLFAARPRHQRREQASSRASGRRIGSGGGSRSSVTSAPTGSWGARRPRPCSRQSSSP